MITGASRRSNAELTQQSYSVLLQDLRQQKFLIGVAVNTPRSVEFLPRPVRLLRIQQKNDIGLPALLKRVVH